MQRRTRDNSEPPHGTLRRYQSKTYRCRCQECKTANTEAWKEERRKRMARLAADPTIIKHGTYNGYHNWGCTCDPCLNAALNTRRKREGLPERLDNPVRDRTKRGLNPLRRPRKDVIVPRENVMMPDLFDAKKDRGKRRPRIEPFGREWLQDAV